MPAPISPSNPGQRNQTWGPRGVYPKIHTRPAMFYLALPLSEKPKKEYSCNPIRSPAFISPPFSAPTPPGSAPGSSGLCHFHPTKAWRRGDGRPRQHFSQRRQTRVPAARPFGASANPTHPGNKSGRGAAGRSPQRSPRAPRASPPRPQVPGPRAAAASCVARLQASSAATVPAKFSGRRVLIAGANRAGRCRGARSPGARGGEGGEGRGAGKATYTTSLEMIHDTMAGRRAGAAGAARRGSAAGGAGGCGAPGTSVRARPPPPPD